MKRPLAVAYLLLLLFFTYSFACLWSLFLAGGFAFHDLTLISDFFANAAYRGRVFWVSDMQMNHLAIHFTPTFLLFVPFFRLSQSQFTLILISLVCMYGAIAFQLAILNRLLESASGALSERVRTYILAAFVVIFCLWDWTRSIIIAAHYEPIFALFASAALWSAVSGRVFWKTALLSACAAGCREDAGVFLAFQLACVPFFPALGARERRQARKTVLMISPLSILYSLVAMKILIPWFGGNSDAWAGKLFARFGNSWFEIIWNMATHPADVLAELKNSAFLPLYRSMLFVPFLHPVIFLLSGLPGIFYFCSNAADKKHLLWYNAAMITPGFLLASSVGFYQLLSLLHRIPVRKLTRARLAVLPLVLLAVGVGDRIKCSRGGSYGIFPPVMDRTVTENLDRVLLRCPEISSVAAGFNDIIYLPNRVQKLLISHSERADAIVAFDHGKDHVADQALKDPGFSKIELTGMPFQIFLRKNLGCALSVRSGASAS